MSARSIRRAHRRRTASLVAASAAVGAALVPAVASGATYTVTNNTDSGTGSLRQVVNEANNTVAPDTIEFAPNVTGSIIVTAGSPIVIGRSLTIDGPGAENLLVYNASTYPLFVNTNFSDTVVEIEGLNLIGNTSGGGAGGGGLRTGSGESTTVRNCIISGTTTGLGGAVFVENTTLNVIDSTIAQGTAAVAGGGIFGRDAEIVVRGSTIRGNKGGVGGGIYAAEPNGGTPTSLTVNDSKITGNQATGSFGGGIGTGSLDGPTSIARTTLSGNSAPIGVGGGMYFGYATSLTVDSSTFAQNTAQDGAGLYVKAPTGPTLISDSTFTANNTVGKGGGIYSYGYFDKPVRIQNSTIASNTSGGGGGGIFRQGFDGTGPGYEGPDEIALSSTVVANNIGPAGSGDLGQGPLATGSFVADHSLVGSVGSTALTESAPGTNKLNGGPVGLAQLADNGGPTQTMLPSGDGPLIDAGAANGLTTDQRGLARSVRQPGTTGADATDIGAVELQDSSLDGAQVKVKRKQKVKGGKIVVKVQAGAGEAVKVVASGTVKLGKKKQLELTKAEADAAAGEKATLKLKPKGKKAAKKIAKVLASGKKAKASIEVTFTDGAGNSGTDSSKVTLSAKGKKK